MSNEQLWQKLREVIEETALLKQEIKTLTSQNRELSARWENLNKEIKHRVGDIRVERVFDPTRFSERLSIVVDFDPYLYRASEFEFDREVLMKVVEKFRGEFNKRLKETV